MKTHTDDSVRPQPLFAKSFVADKGRLFMVKQWMDVISIYGFFPLFNDLATASTFSEPTLTEYFCAMNAVKNKTRGVGNLKAKREAALNTIFQCGKNSKSGKTITMASLLTPRPMNSICKIDSKTSVEICSLNFVQLSNLCNLIRLTRCNEWKVVQKQLYGDYEIVFTKRPDYATDPFMIRPTNETRSADRNVSDFGEWFGDSKFQLLAAANQYFSTEVTGGTDTYHTTFAPGSLRRNDDTPKLKGGKKRASPNQGNTSSGKKKMASDDARTGVEASEPRVLFQDKSATPTFTTITAVSTTTPKRGTGTSMASSHTPKQKTEAVLLTLKEVLKHAGIDVSLVTEEHATAIVHGVSEKLGGDGVLFEEEVDKDKKQNGRDLGENTTPKGYNRASDTVHTSVVEAVKEAIQRGGGGQKKTKHLTSEQTGFFHEATKLEWNGLFTEQNVLSHLVDQLHCQIILFVPSGSRTFGNKFKTSGRHLFLMTIQGEMSDDVTELQYAVLSQHTQYEEGYGSERGSGEGGSGNDTDHNNGF